MDGYPDLGRLMDGLFGINPEYQLCFLGDALLAFPPDPQVTVSVVVSACTVHRIASVVAGFSEQDLDEADRAIAKAPQAERDEILRYDRTYSDSELQLGYRSFATVWAGLVENHRGQAGEALARFRRAADQSLPGWRADQLLAKGLDGKDHPACLR